MTMKMMTAAGRGTKAKGSQDTEKDAQWCLLGWGRLQGHTEHKGQERHYVLSWILISA